MIQILNASPFIMVNCLLDHTHPLELENEFKLEIWEMFSIPVKKVH